MPQCQTCAKRVATCVCGKRQAVVLGPRSVGGGQMCSRCLQSFCSRMTHDATVEKSFVVNRA